MIACTPEAKEKLKAEIERLSTAKFTLYGYVHEVVLTQPGYVDGTHIHTICEAIQTFLSQDEVRGLIITTPPRHMKSTIVSECLPAWFVSENPQRDVIISSYSQTQARKMARSCRDKFDHPTHRRIWPGQEWKVDAADELQLAGKINGRPNIIAVGVGSGITGSGADLIVIDDPVKGEEDADSVTMRDKIYEWYKWVLESRLSPGGKKILVMTRWHHDDLVGRILVDDAESWQVVHMPAISDEGGALWPERYPIPELMKKKAVLGSRAFEAQYQGRPTPLEGGMFKRIWIRIVKEPFPKSAQRCRYWDKAATKGAGDYTTGALVAYMDGRERIEDMVRVQYGPADVQKLIAAVAQQDGYDVKIRMEQEPGSAGVEVIDLYARQILQGYDFRPDKVTGSKELRAGPLAAAFENGIIEIVEGAWNREFIEELLEFPLGKNDDQVDATSGAHHEVTSTLEQRIFFLD